MKKKLFLVSVLVLLLSGLFFAYKKYENVKQEKLGKINSSISHFQASYDYLSKFKWNYPIPSWDLILLNKKWEEIHLEDRNMPLEKIKNLYAIQWTTCNILKNDKNFQKINYDDRYSIIDKNGKVLFKKCFVYSVTKNRKYFQIASLDKNQKTTLLWNSKKSIIKAFDAPVLVKDGSSDFLPYAGEKVSPIFKVKNLWNSDLLMKIVDEEQNEKTVKLKEWNNVILSWSVNGVYQISLYWKMDKNTKLKFIDTNGSIVYIKWDENNRVSFQLKDYQIDENKIDYIVETWRFIADIVKLSPDKNMNVSANGTTLVIRWTHFSISADKDEFDVYLNLWKIVQKLKDKILNLDKNMSFSSLVNWELKGNKQAMKKLISMLVKNDIQNYPDFKFEITWNKPLADILSWSKNIININFENGESIKFVVVDKTELENIVSKNKEKKYEYLKEACGKDIWCIETMKYTDIVNNFCKKNLSKSWLDVDKLHYILDIKWSKFDLKWKIKDKLAKKSYILLTNRLGWVNGHINYSSRVWFDYKGVVEDISLPRLKYQDIDKVVFLCEN